MSAIMSASMSARMISARGLCKRFGPTRALVDTSVEVRAGERVGFLGRNGAGKSTLLRVIAGFLAPDSGSCEVDGVDVISEPTRAQKAIGFLPEGAPAYPEMRARDYLVMRARLKGLAASAAASDADARLEAVGLAERGKSPVQTLSRGMRQRLGLADALLADPRLLILDEPTSGLDPAQLRELVDLVAQLAADRALIFASHRLDAVSALCDRLVVMNEGTIVFDDTVAALADREGGDLEAAFLALTKTDKTDKTGKKATR